LFREKHGRAVHAQGRGDSKLPDSAKHAIYAHDNQEDIKADHSESGWLARVEIVNLVGETKDENQHGHTDHKVAATRKDVAHALAFKSSWFSSASSGSDFPSPAALPQLLPKCYRNASNEKDEPLNRL
jgi:hypothetical protein